MSTSAPPVVGSIRALMDAFASAQAEVASSPLLSDLEPLTLYRWREDLMDAPALWNWWTRDDYVQVDTARGQDSFLIETRIGVAPADEAGATLEDLELYIDAYRFAMDPVFRREVAGSGQLLGGAARWAARVSMAPFAEDVGGQVFRGVAFVQRFDLPRIVLPSS